ncbi:MAG: DUF4329 domain-containing protein [Sedimentitalea sp.]
MKALLAALLIVPAAASAQDPGLDAYARALLAQLQPISIAAQREYCGMIGVRADGTLVASKPHRGSRNGCRPRRPRRVDAVIASYHTHGAYDFDADSEVPSVRDVITDMDAGLTGYVSTPGGRLWHIDGQTGDSRQLCGIGCLPSDPGFLALDWGPVRPSYSLEDLEQR